MIYTITFSPSIDYVINSNKEFNQDGLNRIDDFNFLPGGKGINASIILNSLNIKNTAITFLNGSTKQMFLELLKQQNQESIIFNCENNTRINIKCHFNKNSFEINGPKSIIKEEELNKLFKLIDDLNKDDFVFIMGTCQDEILFPLIEKINNKKVNFALDIDSKKIIDLLPLNPFIIKPNIDELCTLINKKINNESEVKQAMIDLKNKGVKNVFVSNGSKGSYFLDQDYNFFNIKITKKFNPVSTVGSGDTLLSSFIGFYLFKKMSIIDSLKKATSMSIGTALKTFLATFEDEDKYLDSIEIIKN